MVTVVTVVGGTGYAGSAIVREAASRGYRVRSMSRTVPELAAQVDGVEYVAGSMLEADVRTVAVQGSDVIISAMSPRGELDGRIVEVDRELAALASEHGVRFGVVGGFGSLRPQEGAPRMAEGDDLPPEFAGEGKQMNSVLVELDTAPDALDWFFISPAMIFGAHAPGEALGRYRVGGEVALLNSEGTSAISGADFALAVVDEIETPRHRRAHFGVAH